MTCLCERCKVTREFTEKEYWSFVRVTLFTGFFFGVLIGSLVLAFVVRPLF